MTEDEDSSPSSPMDGPTVMGPSTGNLKGPAPEEPTLPDTPPSARARPDQAASPPPSSPRPGTPARPGDPTPATPRNPPAGPSAPDPTIAPQSQSTWPDGPTVTTSRDRIPVDAPQGQPAALDEPTTPPDQAAPDDASTPGDPTVAAHSRPAWPDGPTVATPRDRIPADAQQGQSAWLDEPTVATPRDQIPVDAPQRHSSRPDGPTVAIPRDEDTVADPEAPGHDLPTMSVVDESPTTTGPTVGSWPLDELMPAPPSDLVWRPDTPEPPAAPRKPGYYVMLGAAVVLVVAVVAAAAVVSVVRPAREVAGAARPAQTVPRITDSESVPAPAPPAANPVAGHPLSASGARMADATCALPRFGPADGRQAAFYTAAKSCADDAWRGVLDEAGLGGDATVDVVTVTKPVQTGSCGEITPASPATQCDGTVYMTPAYLRDAEQNGRYPGRYFGVFLREYARALQYTTGLAALTADIGDGEKRLTQQATCMAGIASGAMANRGAVDANITGEIGDRLSGVDAPPDAKAWLDKGFQARTLSACNTWA